MSYATDFRFTLFLDLVDRTEDDAAYNTIDTFVTAQSGTFRWNSEQTSGGGVNIRADLFIPVVDRSEVHTKCNLIESNLDALPRSGECVRDVEICVIQKGLP
jgi:hypothetical protein